MKIEMVAVMNDAVRGMAAVRQQAYNNAADALENAFRNVRANPDRNLDQAAEQEIANDAAQRAEIIECERNERNR